MSGTDESIPQLFGEAVEQLGKLVHNEVHLATAEMSQNVARAAKGAGLLAGAGLLFIPTAVMLMISLALFIMQHGVSPVGAYLISAGVGLVIMVILAVVGKSFLTADNLKLKVTAQQVERDIATAKELAK